MKYYGVYKVFIENGKKDMWLWGAWTDKETANEVGVEIQDTSYSVEVITSDEYPEQHIVK